MTAGLSALCRSSFCFVVGVINDRFGKQFNNREWDSVSVCLVIVCVLTNLSQLPFFAARSSTRMISVAAWFALALFMLLKRTSRLWIYGSLGC